MRTHITRQDILDFMRDIPGLEEEYLRILHLKPGHGHIQNLFRIAACGLLSREYGGKLDEISSNWRGEFPGLEEWVRNHPEKFPEE
jgi:hypothetical protein